MNLSVSTTTLVEVWTRYFTIHSTSPDLSPEGVQTQGLISLGAQVVCIMSV